MSQSNIQNYNLSDIVNMNIDQQIKDTNKEFKKLIKSIPKNMQKKIKTYEKN